MATYVIASKGEHDLVCDTGDLEYEPDPVRLGYGSSDRRPAKNSFQTVLDFVESRYPQYEIFFGPNHPAFGDKFVTYLTICELEIQPGSFKELRRAVGESDRAIREKVGAMWEWGACLIGGNRAALVIAWLDMAYFAQHRADFLNIKHNRFMATFATGNAHSTDYKVLRDGTITEFDPQLLSEGERQVFERASEIRFEVVHRKHPEKRTPLTMA
jgi:hypothetical protein